MPIPTPRRPAVALALALVVLAGLAAPAAASPWTEAWGRLAGWFAATPLGALWAADEGAPGGDDGETGQSNRNGGPQALWANDGPNVPPVGKPVLILSDEGIGVDPSGTPRP